MKANMMSKLSTESNQHVFLFKYFSVVLLAGIYPAIFHYANNVRIVLLSSLLGLSIVLIGISLIVFLIIYVIARRNAFQAIIGTLLFLLFFNIYGPVYEGLESLDLIQVETYSFLPFYLLLSFYFSLGLSKTKRMSAMKIIKGATLIFGVLIIFNLTKIVPVEIRKNRAIENQESYVLQKPVSKNHPDIYYLIFDEAAGFEAVRQYWGDDSVDAYVNFLQSKGFYVAEESHSGSLYTWVEIPNRLNYQEYPIGREYNDLHNKAIANNRVMEFLKNRGYTVVAFEQRRNAFPTADPLPADYLIEQAPDTMLSSFSWMDEYKMLVFRNTMISPFILNLTPYMAPHKDMILYTIQNVASPQAPSPKFVYVHLLFPHSPFVFTARGDIVTGRAEQYNWQNYLGTYKYFLVVSKKMVEDILAMSDPERPPVIIIQSDHGARNVKSIHFSGNLKNYPDEFKTLIVNAMYLPECDDAPLTQDMNPINTFPVVFNCYFDTDIPLH